MLHLSGAAWRSACGIFFSRDCCFKIKLSHFPHFCCSGQPRRCVPYWWRGGMCSTEIRTERGDRLAFKSISIPRILSGCTERSWGQVEHQNPDLRHPRQHCASAQKHTPEQASQQARGKHDIGLDSILEERSFSGTASDFDSPCIQYSCNGMYGTAPGASETFVFVKILLTTPRGRKPAILTAAEANKTLPLSRKLQKVGLPGRLFLTTFPSSLRSQMTTLLMNDGTYYQLTSLFYLALPYPTRHPDSCSTRTCPLMVQEQTK